MGGVGRKPKVKRSDLHQFMWENADRAGRIRFNQSSWAEEFGVHRVTMARMMKELTDAGSIKKLGAGVNQVVLYLVTPPDSLPPESPPGSPQPTGPRSPEGNPGTTDSGPSSSGRERKIRPMLRPRRVENKTSNSRRVSQPTEPNKQHSIVA